MFPTFCFVFFSLFLVSPFLYEKYSKTDTSPTESSQSRKQFPPRPTRGKKTTQIIINIKYVIKNQKLAKN